MNTRIILVVAFIISISAHASSSISETTDEMTGDKSIYLHLGDGSATKTMVFPYSGVTSTIYIGCDKKSTWAYFYFSMAPNLTKTTIGRGRNFIKARGKIGDSIESVSLVQEWGSKFLYIKYAGWFIKKLKKIDPFTILIELPWYGNSGTYFKYVTPNVVSDIKDFESRCEDIKKQRK